MDVCILSGFPGSISSTWQQAGRAGRNGQEALIVLMASEDPLDLFLVRNSAYFFGQSCEKAIVAPDKVQFLVDHILCASRELPLTREDSQYWPETQYYNVVKYLHGQGSLELVSDNPKKYSNKGVIEKFGLRGDSDQYSVVTPRQKIVERYEFKDLLTDAYPGSILNIMGSSYIVKEIKFDSKEILLSDLPPNLNGSYTLPVVKSGISNLREESQHKAAKIPTFSGELTVNNSLEEYIMVKPGGKKTQFTLTQKIDPYRLTTIGMWLDFPEDIYGVLHAIEHLIRVVLPWMVMCERGDLGSLIEGNRIYVYDNHTGGIGLVESALPMVNELLQRCYEVVISCRCENGCPSCIHIPQCSTRNEKLDKRGALTLLAGILGHKAEAVNAGPPVAFKTRTELKLAARHIEKQWNDK